MSFCVVRHGIFNQIGARIRILTNQYLVTRIRILFACAQMMWHVSVVKCALYVVARVFSMM